jgi:hypothetical protein
MSKPIIVQNPDTGEFVEAQGHTMIGGNGFCHNHYYATAAQARAAYEAELSDMDKAWAPQFKKWYKVVKSTDALTQVEYRAGTEAKPGKTYNIVRLYK